MLEVIITKEELYDKCENVEQLYDGFYYPLLVEYKELKKQYCERTDCSGRLGNSKKIDQLEKELEQLKEIEKEHQRINGRLHLEIRRLKEELEQWKKKYGSL